MATQLVTSVKGPSRLLFLFIVVFIASCAPGAPEGGMGQYGTPEVDFYQVTTTSAEVEKKYPGNIEGIVNVDIKAQVTGYLETIYVKEGDYVSQGQSLFKIKADVFNEQVNNAQAALKSALANQATAKIEVEKIKPLVEGNVVSKMQLESAQAAYDAASAAVAQARAGAGSAQINANFSLIKAPVSGYIGRIPNRIGNLVGPTDVTPLTTLSEISTVFVYFSLSEAEYITFMKERKEGSQDMDWVTLIMADGSVYDHKGKLEIASGNIDRATASIALKAIFPNPDKMLRAGGSARIVLSKTLGTVLTVPMACVKDIQDKFFVFALGDSSKVSMKPLEIAGRSGINYLVKSGVKAGDKIALTGTDMLTEGMPVKPKFITQDTLHQ
jgi:membrane fusion protein (multidrug efflux system)